MPNFFSLTRKSNPDNGPVKFVLIDEELCKEFDKPVDPKRWLVGWYDSIGFYLAIGKSWDWIRNENSEKLKEEELRETPDKSWIEWLNLSTKICNYLENNFTVDCGYESHKF